MEEGKTYPQPYAEGINTSAGDGSAQPPGAEIKTTLFGLFRAGDGSAQPPGAEIKTTLFGLFRAGDGSAQPPGAEIKTTLFGLFRAGDGTRTHDLLLGKETFYQLNHARSRLNDKSDFT